MVESSSENFFADMSKIVSKGIHITFCWIPSHIDNKGNEKADRAGKDALSEAQRECFQLLYTNIFFIEIQPFISSF